MKFSYNWLKELARFKESPEKLAELLTLRAFEVEGLEKVGDDWRLDIQVQKSNRAADASGHIGVAREIAALTGATLNFQKRKTGMKVGSVKKYLTVNGGNKNDCRRYIGAVIDGVKVGPSPAWLSSRLALCGVQAINNLVDVANYVMLETGQPLHVFDHARIVGKKEVKQIVVRRAKPGERLLALDDKEYALSEDVLVIADPEKPLAIAGIKGGKSSGVTAETHTIVCEAANFDPAVIRRASRLLNLKTDASMRFEHDLDPNGAEGALRRLADLIIAVAGGRVQGVADVYLVRSVSRRILFRCDYASRLIGCEVPLAFYKKAFQGLGMTVSAKSKTQLLVGVPTARRDIVLEEDLIEEAARLYGYEKIPARLPETLFIGATESDELFWERRVCEALRGAGCMETFVYQFTGERELAEFHAGVGDCVEVANPISPDARYLLARPVIKYIKQAADNMKHEEGVRLFGIAKSMRAVASELTGVRERKHLAVVVAARAGKAGSEFYELKGAIDDLLDSCGITDHWYDDAALQSMDPARPQMFHPYRSAEIKIGDQKIGNIGEVHPAIVERIKSKGRIAAAEIDVERLGQSAKASAEYRPASRFPAIVRDIALVVPQRVKTDDVLQVFDEKGGGLLVDADLFDYFEDDRMRRAGEKSIAFHLVFQSAERTLADKEIDAMLMSFVKELEKSGWKVRR